MGIPFFFAGIRRYDQLCVDGGTLWNYPIDIFDDLHFVSNGKVAEDVDYEHAHLGGETVFNKETLGLRVDTKAEMRRVRKGVVETKPTGNVAEALPEVLGMLLDAVSNSHLHKNDWHRTIQICGCGISTTDFDLDEGEVTMLRKSGAESAREYLNWYDNWKERGLEKPLNHVEG